MVGAGSLIPTRGNFIFLRKLFKTLDVNFVQKAKSEWPSGIQHFITYLGAILTFYWLKRSKLKL